MGFIEEVQKKRLQEQEDTEQVQNMPNMEIIEELERVKTIRGTKHNAEELTKELYRRAINNIKIGEMNRIKINKSSFEDKDEIIDILLYTVGKLSTDPVFYKINVRKLEGHTPIYKTEAE